MWSMANPAITEHVFDAPYPIESEYNFENAFEKSEFDRKNLKFQEASNMTGAYMGVYGLSSMLFALLFTIYSSKKRINVVERKDCYCVVGRVRHIARWKCLFVTYIDNI